MRHNPPRPAHRQGLIRSVIAVIVTVGAVTVGVGAQGADPDYDSHPLVLTQTGTDTVTGSTDATQPGNQVDWQVDYNLPDTVTPGTEATVVVADAIHPVNEYVPGSLQVAPGWLPQWSNDNGATWSQTELADANQLSMFTTGYQGELVDSQRIHPPLQGQVATASGGDGWKPIPVEDLDGNPRIYALYHLSVLPGTISGTRPDLFCVRQDTGAPCAGGPWPKHLSSTVGPLGHPQQVNDPPMLFDLQGEDAHEYAHEGTRIFYPATRDFQDGTNRVGVGVGCFDWNSVENCGYWEYAHAVQPASGAGIGLEGLARVGDRVYGIVTGNDGLITRTDNAQTFSTVHMLCFDVTTLTQCGFTNTGHVGHGGWHRSIPQELEDKIYFHVYAGSGRAGIECFDPATQTRCGAPWPGTSPSFPTPNSININGGTFNNIRPIGNMTHRTLYVLRDTTGTPVGICQAFYATANGTGIVSTQIAWGQHTGCADHNTGALLGHRTRLAQVTGGVVFGSHGNSNAGTLLHLIPSNIFTYSAPQAFNNNVWVPEEHTYTDTRDGQIRELFTNSSGSAITGSGWGDRLTCWNWTTSAPCVTATGDPFPNGDGVLWYTGVTPPPNGAGLQVYGFDTRGNCSYGLNHHGTLFSFDVNDLSGGNGSGFPCRQLAQTASLDVAPDCASGQGAWKEVRVTGFQQDQVQNPAITVHDGNGNIVPGYDKVPLVFDPTGTATIDISTLPTSGPTGSLTADFTATYLSHDPFTNGDPMVHLVADQSTAHMCFSTVTPNDCALVGDQIMNAGSATTATASGSHFAESINNMDVIADAECAATVTIDKDDGRTVVSPGDTYEYTITVTNQGPGPATNTTVTDTIPADLTLDGSVTTDTGTCDVTGATITCELGTLTVGQTAVITVPVEADTTFSGATVENTAEVCHDETGTPVCTSDTDIDLVAGSISGRTWTDLNNDGIQDPGEDGVAGIHVSLIGPGPDGIFGNGDDEELDSTSTGNNGEYRFDGLIDGDYQVRFEPPPGTPISPQNQGGDDTIDSDADPVTGVTAPVTVTAGATVEHVDAGLNPPLVDINGLVWADENADGLQTPGEPGVGDVEVTLISAGPDGIFGNGDDEIIGTTTTNPDGTYTFTDVVPGDYRVVVTPPVDSTFTSQDQGGDDTIDSDVDGDGESGTFNSTDGPDAGLVPNFTPAADQRITPQGVAVTFNVLDNDNIAGRAPGTNLPAGFTYTRATSPTWGSITCTANNGNCTYTPTSHYVGFDTFTYVLHSTTWGDFPLNVTLESLYVNNAPIIRADRARTTPDTPVTFNVLSNDEDPNDPGSSWEPSGPNRPGDALTVTNTGPVTPVEAGTVTCNPGGDCEFTPTPGYTGIAAFTYSAADTGISDPRVDDPGVPGGIVPVDPKAGTTTVTIWVDPDPIALVGFTGQDTEAPVTGTRSYPETGPVPDVDMACVSNTPRATITWVAVPEATRYRIERTSPADPAGWVHIASINAGGTLTHTDTRIGEGNDYQYRIKPELHRWNGTPSAPTVADQVIKPSGNPTGCNP